MLSIIIYLTVQTIKSKIFKFILTVQIKINLPNVVTLTEIGAAAVSNCFDYVGGNYVKVTVLIKIYYTRCRTFLNSK